MSIFTKKQSWWVHTITVTMSVVLRIMYRGIRQYVMLTPTHLTSFFVFFARVGGPNVEDPKPYWWRELRPLALSGQKDESFSQGSMLTQCLPATRIYSENMMWSWLPKLWMMYRDVARPKIIGLAKRRVGGGGGALRGEGPEGGRVNRERTVHILITLSSSSFFPFLHFFKRFF